ncbi:CD9 antigen-like [Seriola lalandi dorsalis]|uniref:CD9 antigen-like n=1 Tax=Seriola lalandi dorsalis TaxID=1841481 RepID=UPI000C6F79EE|nr:CD9 antigen-like [Seriola lalandi dorsalis]
MSALTSWELFVKYALFIFNFVFWLAGTGVLAVGLWLRFDNRTAGLFEGEDSPTVFFTGKIIEIQDLHKMCWTRITLYLTSASSSQLDCCGPTGTVIDAAKDICPKKEGLEVLITKSCPNAIDEMFNNRLHIIGGVGIGIGVIMIFGMIFSMMLCCAIKRSRDFV